MREGLTYTLRTEYYQTLLLISISTFRERYRFNIGRDDMSATFSRRDFLTATACAGGLTLCGDNRGTPAPASTSGGFRFALNTGTVRGYKLPLAAQIDLTAQAGYA